MSNEPVDEQCLQRLLADRQLEQLITRGFYRRYRRRLLGYRRRAETREAEEAADYLADNPQRFLQPVTDPPEPKTVFGTGFRLRSQPPPTDEAPHFLTTLVVSVLFVPLFPLRRYLVRRGADEGEQFEGRVQMSPAYHLWQFVALAALAVGAIAPLAYLAWLEFHEPPVQIVNGLNEPAQVSIDDDQTVDVDALSLHTEPMSPGQRELTTYTADGEHIETFDFEVPRGKDLIVYNIAGVADAHVASVTYISEDLIDSDEDVTWPEEERITLAGLRHYVRDNVRFIDEPPPEELSHAVADTTMHWEFYFRKMPPNDAARRLLEDHEERFDDYMQTTLPLYPDNTGLHTPLQEYLNDLVHTDGDATDAWMQRLERIATDNPEALELQRAFISLSDQFSDQIDAPDPESWAKQLHQQRGDEATTLLVAEVTDDEDRRDEMLDRLVVDADELADDDTISEYAARAHLMVAQQRQSQRRCDDVLDHYAAWSRADSDWLPGDPDLFFVAWCALETDHVDRGRQLFEQLADVDTGYAHSAAIHYGRLILSTDGDDDPFRLLQRRAEAAPYEYDVTFSHANELAVPISDLPEKSEREHWHVDTAELNAVLLDRPEELIDFIHSHPDTVASAGDGMALLTYFIGGAVDAHTIRDEAKIYLNSPWEWVETLPEKTDDYSFEPDPPEHWSPRDRSAYLLARALTTPDDDLRRQALRDTLDEHALWGPKQAVATALLDE